MAANLSTDPVGVASIGEGVNNLAFRDPTDTEMTAQKVAIITIMTTSNVFMLLGNGFSIYIILRCRSLRMHTYYWLVLNLAVLDLMNSSIVVPLNIVWEFHGNWPFSQALCDVEIFFDLGFSTLAAYSTVLLSMDKYLYITKPFFYHTYVGPKLTLGSIVATWVIWMTYSAASVFGELARSTKDYKYDFPLDNCNFVLRHAYAITSFILVFFIPLMILIFTSSRILYVARKHIVKIQDNHRMSDAATTSFDLSVQVNSVRKSPPKNTVHPASAQISASSISTDQNGVEKENRLNVTVISSAGLQPLPSTSTAAHVNTDNEGSSTTISDNHKNSNCTKTRPNAISTTFRAFGTVTLVVFAYIIMFAPYWIASVVNLGCLCIQPSVFEDYLSIFYYMHSLVNPYIYMATDRRYKKAIRHLMVRSSCGRKCFGRRVVPEIRVSSMQN